MLESILTVDALLLENQGRDPSLVLDGAVDVERYRIAKPRILWILREPNGRGPGDLREYFRSSLFTNNRWQSSAGLMVKVSHGLLNGRKMWGTWANDARAIADCLRDVSIININKRGGDARANWEGLYQATLDFAKLSVNRWPR